MLLCLEGKVRRHTVIYILKQADCRRESAPLKNLTVHSIVIIHKIYGANSSFIIIHFIDHYTCNFLWDILRLPSSRRAAQGLYVNLTL